MNTRYNLVSAINSLSYGYVGFNIAKALYQQQHEISLFPIQIENSVFNTQNDVNVIQRLLNNANFPDYNAPSIRIWHQHQLTQHAGKGLRVGFPIFELDKFSEIEKLHLSNQDMLFVTSQWAKNIIEQNNITVPTNIVNLGVDTSIFNQKDIDVDINRNIYRFLNIGKWEYRKGHNFLIECFEKAFLPQDQVELVLCPTNIFIDDSSWISLVKNSKMANNIRIIPRIENQYKVASLIAHCDCGIFPSRAEGWNLGLLECMAMGLNIITTNYSAHTEFCNNDNAMLLDIKETEFAYDGVFFNNINTDATWACLNNDVEEQCIEYMRKAFNENLNNNLNGIKTGQRFTWENSAKQIIQHLK